MNADSLIISLYRKGITLSPDVAGLNWHGPKGVMSPTLLAALKEHKPLILTVMRTIDSEETLDDWEAVREWIVAPAAVVPRHIAGAGARIGFLYGNDLWPEGYTQQLRSALRVRGVLRTLRPPQSIDVATVVDGEDAVPPQVSAS